ncbi:MAG: peptidoglycan-associated lipoprotein Pal [SAR86 cluster bacterium]|jgi:peptidoglycan-associated lipoprotein|nr:peptidoglycan-associated lipoprotein Pal [SAR86 cluster bacterium]MDG1948932.1 peptidoglycan-associated lipoprotein Pal [SAR86 cluster bacterium]
MYIQSKNRNIFYVSFLMFAVSCSTTNNTEESVYNSTVSSVEVSVAEDSVVSYDEKPITTNAVVYFDFDKFTLSTKSIQTLKSVVRAMNENPDMLITVSGHADERGTREYNLALGQRRGDAVKDYLLLNGINDNRVTVKSFGEEYPLVTGSNEASWSKNRRAEIN